MLENGRRGPQGGIVLFFADNRLWNRKRKCANQAFGFFYPGPSHGGEHQPEGKVGYQIDLERGVYVAGTVGTPGKRMGVNDNRVVYPVLVPEKVAACIGEQKDGQQQCGGDISGESGIHKKPALLRRPAAKIITQRRNPILYQGCENFCYGFRFFYHAADLAYFYLSLLQVSLENAPFGPSFP